MTIYYIQLLFPNINVFHIDEKGYFRYNLTKACSKASAKYTKMIFTKKGRIYVSSRTEQRQQYKKKRKWLYWLGGIILDLLIFEEGIWFFFIINLKNIVKTSNDLL